MKNYVIRHFSDEEAHLASVHYDDLPEHRSLHQKFTATIADYEQRLVATNFDPRVVKDFTGTLITWLVYHVAGADQKIPKTTASQSDPSLTPSLTVSEGSEAQPQSCISSFSAGIYDVLEKMVGISADQIKETVITSEGMAGDILVTVGLSGDLEGQASFSFSKEFAFGLIKAMTFSEVDEIDELACSALAEIANIVSGNAATELSTRGIICDITPPVVTTVQQIPSTDSSSMGAFQLDSSLGEMAISVGR